MVPLAGIGMTLQRLQIGGVVEIILRIRDLPGLKRRADRLEKRQLLLRDKAQLQRLGRLLPPQGLDGPNGVAAHGRAPEDAALRLLPVGAKKKRIVLHGIFRMIKLPPEENAAQRIVADAAAGLCKEGTQGRQGGKRQRRKGKHCR